MLDNRTADTGLTTVELAALRKCDDAAFFHREGRSFARAIKRAGLPTAADPFPQESIVEIECGTQWNDYSREFGTSWPMPQFDAFEMVGNYSGSCWRTTTSMLRKGDTLTLHWSKDIMGAGSDLCKAGFHMDRLTLCVARGDARLTFHIDDSVVAGHSTARMIRNVRPAKEYSIA
jgi:hypothetical protein